MSDYQLTVSDAPTSVDYDVQEIEGTVPGDLAGTLYRNGPGAFNAGPDLFHLLDAHAFVGAATFSAGRVHFRGRIIDTPVRKAELAAGHQTSRRIFQNRKGKRHFLDTKLPDIAAHDIYCWGSAPVACDAPGHHALDPKTLAVTGPAPIAKHRPNGLATFCPMPRVDPASGRLITYIADPGLIRNDTVEFIEFDRAWNAVHKVKHRLHRKGVLLHDLAVTATHYVVPEFAHLNVPKVLSGRTPIYDCAGFPPGYRSKLFLFPRVAGAVWKAIELEPEEQIFHLFNAHDDGDEVVVDAIVYPTPVNFTAFAPPYEKVGPKGLGARPVRFRYNLVTGQTTRTVTDVRVDSPECSPAFFGRLSRYGYAAAKTTVGDEPDPEGYFWYHGFTKVDMAAGTHEDFDAGPHAYCSQPIFVGRAGATVEDDGYLLAWVTDAAKGRTALVILDAQKIAAGPLATLWLKDALPAVSHGVFDLG